MTETAADRAARALLLRQASLITRSQALAAGLTESAVRHRLRPGGPWTAVLPGVYVAGSGELTAGQRDVAVALYAGAGCVITGPAALRHYGVRVQHPPSVDVLVPEPAKRRSVSFVRVHRTKRMPGRFAVAGGVRYAPAARAVADAVWSSAERRAVSALVADAVQRGACTVAELAAELRAGPRQGSAALRAALAEVGEGIRSVAEADLRALIKASGLPEPMYNPRLFAGEEFLASPDAWWPAAGVACEVDSREWHLSPDGWARTQARHSRMTARGILVLHYAPRALAAEPERVAAEIGCALRAGQCRPALGIRAVPAR